MEKFSRTARATDGSMAHTLCLLYIYGYKHTLGLCNIYCYSTATTVERTLLSVAAHVHCLVLNVLSPMSGCHLEVGHFRIRSILSISLCIIISRHLRLGAVAFARHVKRSAFETGARKVVHLH